MSAIQTEDGDEIQQIEPGAASCQCAPYSLTCRKPHSCTECRCNTSGERTGEAHRGARFQRHAECIPPDKSAEAGEKQRQVGWQPAAFYVDVMSHFVDQNLNHEA